MSAEQVGPEPADDDRRVVVPLGYGLCAVYILRPPPPPPPAREGRPPEPPPWEQDEPLW